MKLRCYCCGEEISDDSTFALVTLQETEVDRVFIMKSDHTCRVEDANVIPVRKALLL